MEDESALKIAFRNILKMGNKANTYKFALAKFLLEYSNKFTNDELKSAVKTKKSFDVQYSEIAEFFLKFYWHQECKYRIQHSDPKYTPNVIQSIRKFFGTKYISKTMDKVENSKEKTAKTLDEIEKNVFGKEANKTSNVVPRFHTVKNQNYTDMFFKNKENDRKIVLDAQIINFLKENHALLMDSVLLYCAIFLEKRNKIPRLIQKIDTGDVSRTPINKKFITLFSEQKTCFYCPQKLEKGQIHVDHFIPWSYVFENEPWNMVLACEKCNLKKSASLPEGFLVTLKRRNELLEYVKNKNKIKLKNSLLKLSFSGEWKKEIDLLYTNCKDSGFPEIKLP